MTIRIFIFVLAVMLVGCKPSGPPSTSTTSAAFPTLVERTDFVNQYFTFRRTYEALDFNIHYRNFSGDMVPAPSYWNIRIIATVPASELDEWIPAGVNVSTAPDDIDWLKTVPTTLDVTGVSEWYIDGRRTIGIDRLKHIVVYRNYAN